MSVTRFLSIALLAAICTSIVAEASGSSADDGQQVLSAFGGLQPVRDELEEPRFADADATSSQRAGSLGLADAQAYEQQSLASLISLVCLGEETPFFSKILRNQLFTSTLHLPFGVTADDISSAFLVALRNGHCRYNGEGDVPSAGVTASAAPAFSHLLFHLLKEAVESAMPASDQVGGAEIAAARSISDKAHIDLDTAGSLIYTELALVIQRSSELRKFIEQYRQSWLTLRELPDTASSELAKSLVSLMTAFVSILVHPETYQIRAAFGHVAGFYCLSDEQSCPLDFQQAMTRHLLTLASRQVHSLAITHEVLQARDANIASEDVLNQRLIRSAELLVVAEAVVTLVEDPHTLADVVLAPEALLSLHDSLLAKEGASAARKNLFSNRHQGNDNSDVSKKQQNTLFAIFKRLGLAKVVHRASAEGVVSDVSSNSDTDTLELLSPTYLGLVSSIRTTVQKSLFGQRTGKPVPISYPPNAGVQLLALPNRWEYTALKYATGLFEPWISQSANANPIPLLSGIKTIAKAILMLDAAAKAGLKAQEGDGGSFTHVPMTILAAAQIIFAEGQHENTFSVVAPGVAKYSEDKIVLRASQKWQSRSLVVTNSQASYTEVGSENNGRPSGVMPFGEMDGILLPAPTTPQARRDKALDAAFTKQAEGNICGSFLQTPKPTSKKGIKRRRKQVLHPHNFVGQLSLSQIKQRSAAADEPITEALVIDNDGGHHRHHRHSQRHSHRSSVAQQQPAQGGNNNNNNNNLVGADNAYEFVDAQGNRRQVYYPYRQKEVLRYSPAMYIPDPQPTSRYFTFCTSTPLPATSTPAQQDKWVALTARPFLAAFCAAAHNKGITHRFRLEERFSFNAWALSVDPLPGGPAAVSEPKGIRDLADTNLPKHIIHALKRNNLLRPAAGGNGNNAQQVPADQLASPDVFSCSYLFEQAVTTKYEKLTAQVPEALGLTNQEIERYRANLPIKSTGILPWELSPVLASRPQLATKGHPAFGIVESIASQVMNEHYNQYSIYLARQRIRAIAAKGGGARISENNVYSLDMILNDIEEEEPDLWKLIENDPLIPKKVPRDFLRDDLEKFDEECMSPADEKAELERRQKGNVLKRAVKGGMAPLAARQYYSIHAAMTYNRPVSVALTPGMKWMAQFSRGQFYNKGFFEDSFYGKDSNGGFSPRFRKDPDIADRDSKVSVHVSERDKLVIVSFRWAQMDDGLTYFYKVLGNSVHKLSRYRSARAVLQQVMEDHSDKHIVLTGYCLGAGIALALSKEFALPVYAIRPAPAVTVSGRMKIATGMAVLFLLADLGTGFTMGRALARLPGVTNLPFVGGQTAAYMRMLSPRDFFGYRVEGIMYAATHKAAPGNGLNKILAVAGDPLSAPYFLRDKDGRDIPGYDLALIPPLCKRSIWTAHGLYFDGAIPTTDHPMFRKHPELLKPLTFPNIKPYSVGSYDKDAAMTPQGSKGGGDSQWITYDYIYSVLDVYEKAFQSWPTLQWPTFSQSEAELLGGTNAEASLYRKEDDRVQTLKTYLEVTAREGRAERAKREKEKKAERWRKVTRVVTLGIGGRPRPRADSQAESSGESKIEEEGSVAGQQQQQRPAQQQPVQQLLPQGNIVLESGNNVEADEELENYYNDVSMQNKLLALQQAQQQQQEEDEEENSSFHSSEMQDEHH